MEALKKIKNSLIKTAMFIIYAVFGVQDKVVLSSFNGKTYSDNPKAISEELHKTHPTVKIVWLFKNPNEKKDILPAYVNTAKFNSLKSYYELATAKVWVDNFNKPIFLFKGKKQLYIQTWHGDRGIKKILYDVRNQLSDGTYLEGKLFEETHCDLMLSGSEYAEKYHFESGFHYKGNMLKLGSPRNDKLINKSDSEVTIIKNQLNIQQDVNLLLFAPTMRDSDSNGHHKVREIDLELTLKNLEKATNGKWMGLIRAHSSTKSLEGIPESERFLNVSDHEDMSELLLISDILITDYSSSAGDFALLNKLVILFQSDRDEYISKDRETYFNIDDSPFIVALNQKELNEITVNYSSIDIEGNCKAILDFYGTYETGKASIGVAKLINAHVKDVLI